MKKVFCLSLLSLLFLTTLEAQNDDKPLYLWHTSAQFQELDFTNFNQQLNDLDLLPLSNNIIEIGAGVTRIYNRFSSDLAFVFATIENQSEGIRGPSSRFRHFGFRVSESLNILNPKGSWFFGPEATFNGSFQQILIAEENTANNFQEAASTTVYNFERFSVTGDIGLNLFKTINYNDMFKEPRTMSIGVRGGYRVNSDVENWFLNKAITQENLGIVNEGWYAALVLGVSLY